ncbi:MAG: transcriptional repressor [Solirubrobacterales bacterium]|nr:transcriptional repressor [Solirubrobacterales bacterium]
MLSSTPPEVDDARLLRDSGLRVTAPRLAVLAAVREGHPTVDEIASRARTRVGTVSIQAVYDVLKALTTAGLARRIEPPGSPARFEARAGDNHHHLVCRVCGAVADVDCVTGHAPCLVPGDNAGYLVDEADVTFWGVCPACQLKDQPRESA